MVHAAGGGHAVVNHEQVAQAVVDRIHAVCKRGNWIPFRSTEETLHNAFCYNNEGHPLHREYVMKYLPGGAVGGGAVGGFVGCLIGGLATGGAGGAAKGAAKSAWSGPGAKAGAAAGFVIGASAGVWEANRRWHTKAELSNDFQNWVTDWRKNGAWEGLMNYLAEEDPLGRRYRCTCGHNHSLWEPLGDQRDISVVEVDEGDYRLDDVKCRGAALTGEVFVDPRWKLAFYKRAGDVLEPVVRTNHLRNGHLFYQHRLNDILAYVRGQLAQARRDAYEAVGEALNAQSGCPPRFRGQIDDAARGKLPISFHSLLATRHRMPDRVPRGE